MKSYDSTVGRIAGNIASGIVRDAFYRDRNGELMVNAVADDAIAVAERIVYVLEQRTGQTNGVNLGVVRAAYAWTISDDGEVYGLTAGDHGYESTGIKIPKGEL